MFLIPRSLTLPAKPIKTSSKNKKNQKKFVMTKYKLNGPSTHP